MKNKPSMDGMRWSPIAMNDAYFYMLLPQMLLKDNPHSQDSREQSIEMAFEKKMARQSEYAQRSGADQYTAVIDLRGPVVKYSQGYWMGTQTLGRKIKQLDRDSSVCGIVLNIDSGGGMVSGTSELSEIIKGCETPTASFTNGYMCSAAQQIGAACDFSVAHPYADWLGSIGTLLHYQDFSKMFEKWGAKIYEVYAPQSSEKNKGFRALEQGDPQEIEGELEQYTTEMIDTIKRYRGEKLKDDGAVFKGKAYRPQQAKQVGLIDEIQTLEWVLAQFVVNVVN